jgi:hypothetical protein
VLALELMFYLITGMVGVGVFAFYFGRRWERRIDQVRIDHERFVEYMTMLGEEKEINYLLGRFNNHDELHKAVRRLSRCLKSHSLLD